MSKKQLIIMSLEPIESRYTLQWFTHLPEVFKTKLGEDFDIIQINGKQKNNVVTEGAFLDFINTNVWKSEQLLEFFTYFNCNQIADDAIILFTDAWNPCINQIKYTKELCRTNWTLIGIWHAGCYDPADFLGRIDDLTWAKSIELGFYNALDINWFATEFHKKLFLKTYGRDINIDKTFISGFPMEYIANINFPDVEKENLIVFPARMAPEKQPEIVKELEKSLPEYKFVFCCEEKMNKKQYHETLAKAKVMLSVSQQETLGITQCEGMSAKCISLVPDRLSYSEMYNDKSFVYPSNWSETFENANFNELKNLIKQSIEYYEDYLNILENNFEYQLKNFFSCDKIIEKIKLL